MAYKIFCRTKYDTIKSFPKARLSKLQYYKLRNSAWSFLIERNVQSLPVNLDDIIQNLDIILIPYKDIRDIQVLKHEVNSCIAFTAVNTRNNLKAIFYDESQTLTVIRFSIAHELGHIVLHSNQSNPDNLETEAQMFAARILMPMCVLKKLNVKTHEEIMRICLVSEVASKFRLRRLNVLNKRNCFFKNSLEKQVLKNFEKFIQGENNA